MNAFWFWIVKPLITGLAPAAIVVILVAAAGAIVSTDPLWGLVFGVATIAGVAAGIWVVACR